MIFLKETALNEIAGKLTDLMPNFFRKLVKPINQQAKNVMSPMQMHAMEALYSLKKCTMTELSNELKISKQQTTPIVDKLIRAGLVIREHDDIDRRNINIRLTPSGLSFMNDFKEEIFSTMKEKIRNLDDDDLICLENALNDFFKVIHKIP